VSYVVKKLSYFQQNDTIFVDTARICKRFEPWRFQWNAGTGLRYLKHDLLNISVRNFRLCRLF